FLYLNRQDGTFQDITCLAGVRHYNGWGAAYADIDNDGDLDLLAAGGRIQLFRNDTKSTGKWLEVKVTDNDHVDAIGARLDLYNQNFRQIREIQGGKGTTSQHSLIQHIGLDAAEPPFTLKIRFPSGQIKTIIITDLNQIVHVMENDD
ncbi:MAG: CRTAC1 family protein, partial [Candidatus Cloacimonetes bacterium]|nr:CRTAC1 family protein [Candidatus Cloacimonadota bacterium]